MRPAQAAIVSGVASGILLAGAHADHPVWAYGATMPLAALVLRLSQTPKAAPWAFVAGMMAGFVQAQCLLGLSFAGITVFWAVALSHGLALGVMMRWVLAWTFAPYGPGATNVFLWRLWPSTFAGFWVASERLAAWVPFGLPALLGDTQHDGLLLPVAAVGGTWAIGGLMVWFSASVVALVAAPCRRRRNAVAVQLCALFACAMGCRAWGQYRLCLGRQSRSDFLQAAIVQGGLPSWAYDLRGGEVAKKAYTEMTQGLAPTDLVIWPETAVWQIFDIDHKQAIWRQTLARLVRQVGPLLLGAPTRANGTLINAAVLLPGDAPLTFVGKRRLALGPEIAFVPADNPGPLHLGDASLGVVFCLESVVPDYALKLAQDGANIIIILAEGGRFQGTKVARMHAQRSNLRAVETGLTTVFAGQQGQTHVCDGAGHTTSMLPPWVATTARYTLFYGRTQQVMASTPYVRFGNHVLWFWLISPMLSIVFAGRMAFAPTKQNKVGAMTNAAHINPKTVCT